MSAAPVVTLERHVLGSGPALVDAGKDTFGWTPALAGERAARLKSEVPWGIPTARMADPPRLEGDVLAPDNYDRLRFAVMGLEKRMGFCMWGAVGDRPPERAVWRVLTHTILIDGAGLRALAGNPFALLELAQAGDWLRDLARPGSFDERREVLPITLVATPETERAAESLRRREVARLRERLCRMLSPRALGDWLAALYATLSTNQHVVLKTSDDDLNGLLIRLAWLSLPVADRMTVSFSTEQGASAARLPKLAALDPGEWRGRTPENALVLADDTLASVAPTAGQEWWARDVAEGNLARNARAHAWVGARQVRLLSGDGVTALVRYRRLRDSLSTRARGDGPPASPDKILDGLVQAQGAALLSRPGFAGFLLGEAARRLAGDPAILASRVLAAVDRIVPAADASPPAGSGAPALLAARVLRGAVRGLSPAQSSQAGPTQTPPRVLVPQSLAAGRLRCLAVSGRRVPEGELRRLRAGGHEAEAGKAVVADVEGAALFLQALAGLEKGHGDFADLAARARETLSGAPKRFEGVLDALVFASESAAAWGVEFLYGVAAASVGYRPAREVLVRLSDTAVGQTASSETVGRFLAERPNLETLLAKGGQVRAYLENVMPDPVDLAGAMVSAHASEAGVTEAVGYLAGDEDAARQALEAWSRTSSHPDDVRALLLHSGWGGKLADERMRLAARLLSAHTSPAQALGVLSGRAGAGGLLGDEEAALVERALSLLAGSDRLADLPDATWTRLVQRTDRESVVQLDDALGNVPAPRKERERLSGIVLTHALGRGDTTVLGRQLEGMSPAGEYSGYWSGQVGKLSSVQLASKEILTAFARALEAAHAPALARELFVNALAPRSQLSQELVGPLLQLGRLGHEQVAGRLCSAFVNDRGRGLPLLVQLLVEPAPMSLFIELQRAIHQLLESAQQGQYRNAVEPWAKALEQYSPATLALLAPPKRSVKVLFIRSDFVAEVARAAEAQAAAEPS